jgi:type II secretory ATPase GspE/PulE/Tfp pilus assembly ATPase PilB-like protein/CheY-like chemotaxis protein
MQFTDEWLVPSIETLLSDEAVKALRQEDGPDASLWELLVQRKLATDEQILAAIAARFRFPIADLTQLDPKLTGAVPEQLARRFNVVPVRQTDSYLEVATANPFDIDAEKMLAFATGREVRMMLGSPSKIRDRLDELYRETETAVSRLLEGFGGDFEVEQIKEDEEHAASAEEASQRPILRLVDTMIADGVSNRASDIHVEPVEGGVVVRYRIDGVLRQVMKIPRNAGVPLISRIKIMSKLDIADRLRPQDGRARVSVNGEAVDLRISTLPASHGEKVVIRVLNQKATTLALDSLGLGEDEEKAIRSLLGYKEGIILVTGPTGSGKTTTLYSALRAVQGTGVNIVTVEDPVEYRLGENIVQVQVNEKAGLTFASALRSILRQDPDVVLVGEIRDKETAQIALQASLTGHLVLSTLHTNDAPNTVTRLVDIGMESYKIAPALRGIVAQRLMRRLCLKCRVEATEPVAERFRRFVPPGITLYQAVGCSDCSMTGYRGRFSIVEVLIMNPDLERRIADGATAEKIAQAARQAGMRPLWGSGLRHVLAGESTFDELMRVTDIPREETEPPAAPVGGRAGGRTKATAAATPAAPATNFAPSAPAMPDLSMDMDLLEEHAIPGPSLPGGRGQGACVLLVEDEEQLRRVMKDLLQREGYRVAEARDGVQALDEVDRFAPDVIILDLNLPGLDGYGVLSQLRSRPATREIPVMVLTAKGDEDNEVRVFELGADDFVTKPFRARALTARLEAVLSRRRA